jgi:hypothetical protein
VNRRFVGRLGAEEKAKLNIQMKTLPSFCFVNESASRIRDGNDDDEDRDDIARRRLCALSNNS